jgi:tetratricopeptide (TPR) repeat protein
MPSSQPLPNTEANLFKKILKSYEQKQYKKSLQYVKEILKKVPDHGETLSMKGLILNYCNKKSEAYECAQKGLRNDVKSHVCWHVYGLLQRSDRKYDEAIKCYRNALRCDPENLQILRDLSLLQIQIRDLEGYRDTRYTLLQLRPGQRVSWIGYAMSYHLLKDYDIAISILEEFGKTQQTKSIDYEQSELLLYQNMVYREAGLYDQCLSHLDENKRYILDKLCVEETKGEIYIKTSKKDLAAKTYEDLIERNPDNILYYKKLIECSNLTDNVEEQVYFYRQYAEQYSRSDVPRKQPLFFLSGDQFRVAVDKYVRRALTKGVPPLFKELKVLYKDTEKLQIIEDLMLSYVKNLTELSQYSEGDLEKEEPTTLLWVYYYLAQHFDHLRNTERALEFINKAIDYTPTLVESYMIKGKIYKHAGNYYEAVKWMDEAQSLDTADRFVNYKCSKYMLRANMIKEAEEVAGKFTRESTSPFEYLKEMQCMWFETECANSYHRLGQYGESLKKCHQVEKHFTEFIEDQFDFHSYCMRKMTLCSYVDMLRLEDRIKSHPFFFKAAQTAIEVYLRLYDHPLKDSSQTIEDTENFSASELKKLRNKQKKQQLKAAQEKEEKRKVEQKKKELSKAKKNDDGDGEVAVEEELLPEKLERPENPLEELNKFLKPLEEFGLEQVETHILAFEVYSRKNKFLQMLKFLKKLQNFDTKTSDKAKFHYYLCKFMIKYNEAKATLNKTVVDVIETELFENLKGDSVESLNEKFLTLNSSNYLCVIEAAKVMYLLNPATNQMKALDMITDLDFKKYTHATLRLDTVNQVFKLIRNGYFGELNPATLHQLNEKVAKVFGHAMFLKTAENQAADLEKCVKNLSITAQAPEAELADKLGKATLKE